MTTERSESIEKLAEALAAAQATIEGASKDRENPHFKSRYADLASVWDACRGPLTANGLSVVQTTRLGEHGLLLVTTLLHTSGQWVAGELPVGADPRNPQSMGSWLTYARRYALAAIAGVCPEDDDGEAATGRPQGRQDARRPDGPARDTRKADRTSGGPEGPPRGEAESWSHYIGARLRKANGEWLREMAREGIEPDVREAHKELANEPRVVNHLCSRLIELKKLDAATVSKGGSGKAAEARDATKARDAVKWFFETSPGAIRKGVEKYLAAKLNEGRAKLGMPDPDAEDSAGAGAPPPGKGDAYEEALTN